MKTVSVKLPAPMANWLVRRARELKRSQSDLVREALERFQQGRSGVSCHDLLQDVCGSFRGPRDLSANSKHLTGFGK